MGIGGGRPGGAPAADPPPRLVTAVAAHRRRFIDRIHLPEDSVQTIRTFALALAALATLASCDSAPPLGSGEGRTAPPEGPRYATAPFPAPASFAARGPGVDPSSRSVTLTWEDVPGDEMYVVQWRKGGGPDVWKSLVSTGVNRTLYVTDSMSVTQTNDYRVAVLTSDFRTGAFSVLRLKPGAFTQPALLGSDSVATLRGLLRPNGSPSTYWFEWGTSPTLAGAAATQAVQAAPSATPILSVGELVRVAPGGVYYYRMVASGAGGTTHGEILGFTASASIPTGPTGVAAAFSEAPVPLAAGSVSAPYNVTVRWTHDGVNAGSFAVQRRLAGASAWTHVVTLQSSDAGYFDRRYVDQRIPVAADAQYEYRVVACASQCASSATIPVLVKGVPAPAGLSAVQGADGRVTLTWQDLAREEAYPVQWRAGDGPWRTLFTAGKNATSATTDRVYAGTNNYYRVAGEVLQFRVGAYAQTVLAAGSAGLRLRVETGEAVFFSPTSVRAYGTVTPNGIDALAWIEWGTDPALATFTATTRQVKGSGFTALSVSELLTLPAAGKYYYRAAASNSVETVRGPIQSFDTGAPPAPVLAAPAFDPALFRVTLSWTHSGTPAPTQFRVDRRLPGETAWRDLGGVGPAVRSFVDASIPVSQSQLVEYRVRACGASCTLSSVRTVQTQAMAAPPGFTAAQAPNGQVTLTWQDISGEVAYLIQWRSGPNGSWTNVLTTGADRTQYTGSAVTPGTTNYYRVSGEASGFRRGPVSETLLMVP
jgi:hypothetical protein